MLELQNSTSFEYILMENDLVLVDFFATWCPPCKMLSPIIDEFASSREDIKVVKVNIDDYKSISDKYDVHAVPTLIFFKKGVEVKRHMGFLGISQLNDIVDELK